MRRHMVIYFPINPSRNKGQRNKVEATGREKSLTRDADIVGVAALLLLRDAMQQEIFAQQHKESASILVKDCSI